MFGRAAAGYSGSEFRVSGWGVKGFGLGGLGFSGWGLVFIGLLGLGVRGLGVLGLRAYGGLWSSRVCMCECTAEVVNPETRPKKYEIHPHTHTHTHIYIYIHMHGFSPFKLGASPSAASNLDSSPRKAKSENVCRGLHTVWQIQSQSHV